MSPGRASMLAQSPARPPPTTMTGSVMAHASGSWGQWDAFKDPKPRHRWGVNQQMLVGLTWF